MTAYLKKTSLLLFFILSLVFMEFVFRIYTQGQIFSYGFLVAVIFSVAVGSLLFLLCTLFRPRINYILSGVFIFGAAFIFSTQLIYYDFASTFYNFFSAAHAPQAFIEFWGYIVYLLGTNILWIGLLVLPLIFLLTLGRRMLVFEKTGSLFKGLVIGCLVFFHLAGLGSVHAAGDGHHSPSQLYYHGGYPNFSMDRLGLITAMRTDFQREFLEWSGGPEEKVPELPEAEDKDKKDKDVEYNVMDIDFDKLIVEEEDEEIKNMHKYFKNVKPIPKNEHTGKYEGYNLIFITAEGFAPYAVREDITPTLHKMMNEGYQFKDFYTIMWEVSTTDGEYVACTGLIPKSGVWSFYQSSSNYLPFTMGMQLKEQGYKTVAYHNHTYNYYRRDASHPNMGYDYKGIGSGLDVREIWPASDHEMMEVTVPEYIDEEPFHAYYMTVSGHLPYNFIGNNMSIRNRQHVEHLPYCEEGKAYIACHVELDKAMEHLLNELEEAGIKDETLIVMSSDHYPYGLEKETIEELSGREIEDKFDLYKNTLIIYSGDMEPEVIEEPASSLDIIPTLSNLLGLEYDSRLLMGKDLLSDSEPLVIFADQSFITEKGRYDAEKEEFIPREGKEVDEEYVEKISDEVKRKFYFSARMLETDYYSILFEE